MVLHQKTDRDERRLQDQPPNWAVARQRDRDAGAERFAPHHDSLGGVAVGAERIRRGGVQQKPRLARRSGRAAEAVVGYADHAEPVLHEPGEALGAVAQRSAVPLKIEDDRPIRPRRHVPGDQPLTVSRRERDLLGLRQAGGGSPVFCLSASPPRMSPGLVFYIRSISKKAPGDSRELSSIFHRSVRQPAAPIRRRSILSRSFVSARLPYARTRR